MAHPDDGGESLWTWLLLGGGTAAAVITIRSHVARAEPDGAPSNGNVHPTMAAVANANATALAVTSSTPPDRLAPRWVFPVPLWGARRAEISDSYSAREVLYPRAHRKHLGVDIMFRRRSRAELVAEYPPGTADGSPNYFMPRGHLAVAAADGVVWSAGLSPRGHQIVISHGAPWATYYQHLSELFVHATARGASGERVRAGQPIGVIGGDPSPGRPRLRHLHFEIWHGGPGTHAVDPKPHLDRALHIPQPVRPERAAV